MEEKQCSKCKTIKPLTEYYILKSGNRADKPYSCCKDCVKTTNSAYERKTHQPYDQNKDCSSYLGVAVAEKVLSRFFNHIQRMPYGNPGYDFICSKGYKIDVKSACLNYPKPHIRNGKYVQTYNPYWMFSLYKNQIADYFLCLAFSDRETLEPIHIWLIPSSIINMKSGITITNTPKALLKWQPYEKPLDKVIHCCNLLRDTEETIYF